MFSSEEQHPPEYHELKRRQGFIWVFLALVVLLIGGILALLAYSFMTGGGSVTTTSPPVVVTPAPAKSNGIAVQKKSTGTYFLMGELFPVEKKYRISKVYYPSFSKEEFFAVPWRNTAITPAVAHYGDYIAVFSDPGTGIFIGKDGKVASVNDTMFFPPYIYFSLSPDGKKMAYFRYLSSLGTTSLTVRDIGKNEDAFGWPVGSSASEPCKFRGWTKDGAKAYCLSMRRGAATLKTIDVNRYAVATVMTVPGVRDAEYYADSDILVTAERDGIVIREVAVGKRTIIVDSPESKAAENVMLTPDGKTIAFTVNDVVYSADVASGVQQRTHDGVLVGITPDSQRVLLRDPADAFVNGDHYSMAAFDGSGHQSLHTVMNIVSLSQFLGWFSE